MRKQKDRSPLRMLALISQLGICMLTSIFICVFLGWYLAEKTRLEILFPLTLVIGVLAGIRSCYRLIQKFAGLEKESMQLWKKKEESDCHEKDKMDRGNK